MGATDARDARTAAEGIRERKRIESTIQVRPWREMRAVHLTRQDFSFFVRCYPKLSEYVRGKNEALAYLHQAANDAAAALVKQQQKDSKKKK